ncbi:type IV pilus biogenesis protein PilP [Stutzerimonas frequens]|uniref:type IV pilus biogenesis protein PilP n=1 Tax=Stutzerimonas frequens TaxID=2968969 RepID=UPI001AAF118C|nr:type IV pilus biogenesis protein PilP [Stutzerimonas frequens]QTF59136.1 type IV pilus biogenesis protein PilP [Stutzerimonas frequens]
MQRNKAYAVFIMLLFAFGRGETVLADEYVPTFGDLSALQAQKIYWELKGSRDQKKAEATKYGTDPVTGAAPVSAGNSVPQLRGVVGSGQNLYGTFMYDNGSVVEARAGEILPGGFRVNSVSLGKARLLKDGKYIEVMQSTGGREDSIQPTPSLPGMPGLMSPSPIR